MGPRAWNKVESRPYTASLELLKAGLGAEVLRLRRVCRDPLQQPAVALVLAGNLQGDHTVTSKCHHPELTAFAQECETSSHADQPEPRTEVGIVSQRGEKLSDTHLESEDDPPERR